jgi:hypothetical protein
MVSVMKVAQLMHHDIVDDLGWCHQALPVKIQHVSRATTSPAIAHVMDYIQKLGDRAAGNRAQVVGKLSGAFTDPTA